MTPEARLAPVIRRQHGAFTRGQAREARFSDRTIRRRVAAGAWLWPYSGTYIDAAVPRTSEQDAVAACLACGPSAVVSHEWAAHLLGLEVPRPSLVVVTVKLPANPRQSRITVHRTNRLLPVERAVVRRVPITSALRLLLDLAGVLDVGLLEIVLDTLWRRGLIAPERLVRYLADPWCRYLPGTGALRAMAQVRLGCAPPGSDLETIYLQILRAFNVPLPRRQHPVDTPSGRRKIDLAYEEHKVAIELDGFWKQRDRVEYSKEKLRQNEVERLGYTVRRFTWEHLTYDRALVAVRTAEAIGLVPARWKKAG